MRPVFFLSLALAAASALAGRPLQTDDAPVMDPRACELEGARITARQSYLQLGCGIGWETEMGLQALRPRELSLGGKTRLLHGDLQLSLAWGLNHRHVETAWRRTSTGLILVASAPLTREWIVHANLGHQRDEVAHRRSTTWAIAAEHNGLGDEGRWQPMAEVFGDDRGQTWANAALRVELLPERVFVDASYGRQLSGPRARLITAGFKLAF